MSLNFDHPAIQAAANTVKALFQPKDGNNTISTTATVVTALVGLFAYEQYVYLKKKKNLPGPSYKIPIIGALMDSVNPTFDGYMSKWKSGELSCVSVFDRFIVIASSCDLSRKILNSPIYTEPTVVDAMRTILCADNWVFLGGKAHVEYRKGLNVLFTRKALGMYIPIQDKVYAKHFKEWLSMDGKSEQYQWRFRELNMEASLRVFLGDFLSDEVASTISQKYFDITAALELVNFPWPLPGTKVYKAMRARQYIVDRFIEGVQDSRKRLAAGEPVTCMMDAWISSMHQDHKINGTRMFNDREIALTILTFLFASQDATSSALTWAFQLLADHPDVLAKVRAEQIEAREGDLYGDLSYELLEKMPYTRQVVKEILRLRPPVLMVPYQTKKEFPINDNYTVPKGAMVIPTSYPALHDPIAYPEPESFNPDRWGPEGHAEKYPKNYMVFGNGPHHCLGKEYAFLHLIGIVAQASMQLDWVHHRTKDSDNISIFATIYPSDGCIMSFTPRARV
ncbi:RNA polymerase C-22 sterol desaturase [Umbelopsis sp. WA50703]